MIIVTTTTTTSTSSSSPSYIIIIIIIIIIVVVISSNGMSHLQLPVNNTCEINEHAGAVAEELDEELLLFLVLQQLNRQEAIVLAEDFDDLRRGQGRP